MSVLDRKLLRDLASMKGQVATIMLVVACGIAIFVSAISAYVSLKRAQEAYYQSSRFAEVFVHLKRAPVAIEPRLARIAGVAQVETRVSTDALLDVPSVSEPVSARILSLPKGGAAVLDRLYLRLGRMPTERSDDEVVASEAFVNANALEPGDTLSVILGGKRRVLRIVGVALSPEYVYASPPGDPIPDDRRFAVLWMNREPLAAALDLDGAFNDVVFTLAPLANETSVMAGVDAALDRYGGTAAYSRYLQPSNRFLSDEIEQQGIMASTVPLIFLGVACYLVNIVMRRLVQAQREQIAALKALGYHDLTIAAHYLKLIALVTIAGGIVGAVLGAAIARYVTTMYQGFFRFPLLSVEIDAWVPIAAVAMSGFAACLGAVTSLRAILALQPAEAMRMPAPRVYRPKWPWRRAGGRGTWAQNRLILRAIIGRPLRAMLITLGMALSLALIILSTFWQDALDYMIDVQFAAAERQDATATFIEPLAGSAAQAIAHLPGVLGVEPYRTVPVRLRNAQHSYRTTIIGVPENPALRLLIDDKLKTIVIPAAGLFLSQRLADRLALHPGDRVEIEILEKDRPRREAVVSGLTNDQVGLSAYMSAAALARLMREENTVTSVAMQIDSSKAAEFYAALKATPKVQALSVKALSLKTFRATTAQFVLVLAAIFSAFALTITVAIVYNSARIALQERSWELASLRVLGFTQAEVSWLLFGEIAIEALLAIPLGLWIGHFLVATIVDLHETEMFKVPAVIEPKSYAIAVLVVLAAGLMSAWMVRRNIVRLDLVAALKARE